MIYAELYSMLYDHQREVVDKNPHRYLFAFGTGTGKTITSIALAKKNKVRPLIIVPKALKAQWIIQCEKFGLDCLVLTKEEFKKQADILSRFEAVIVDEGHYFSGYTSQMHKSLAKYLATHEVYYRWVLTATPYLSTPYNIYALANILGHEWNWKRFTMKYFFEMRMGKRSIWRPRKNIEDDMAQLVNLIGGTKKLVDCADVPDQVDEDEYFIANKAQDRFVCELEETNPMTLFTKMHQVENGAVKVDAFDDSDDTIKIIDCDKTDRVVELCEQNDKIVIVCRYKAQIQMYTDTLKNKGFNVLEISGDVKDRAAVVLQAEAADKVVVIIQAQCSEGYELPSIPVCVFASMSYSFKDYVQMKGRFLRINKLKKNTYIHLITKDGIDSAIYDAIKRKQDFDTAIYMRRLI